MKPIAHVEMGMGRDKDCKAVDLRRVALVPSHEEGHFVIEDSYFGKQVVSRVVLLDVADEDLEVIHATGEFPLERYVSTDEQGKSDPTVGRFQVNFPYKHGSGNSVNMSVHSIREFAPVTADTPAAA